MSGTDGDGDGPRTGPSRRWFLAGGTAALAGAGMGVGAGFLQPESRPEPRRAPSALADAITAERQLLALAAAAARRDPTLRADVAALVDDHTAHLRALRSAAAGYDTARAGPTPAPTFATTSPVRAQVRAAEQAAATAAARRAALLTGSVAALLASISACESTHVELLVPR